MTVVRFPSKTADSADPMTVAEARERFGANAHTYLDVPGLLWKAYLLSEDGLTVGGTYWWRDRASAEAKFNAAWLAGVTEKYGTPPIVEWFDAPVVVDPRFDMVRVDPPPDRSNLDRSDAERSETAEI